MDNMGNTIKAICMVLGGLAIIGLVTLLLPVLAGLGGLALGLIEALAPLIIIVVAIVLVYKWLKNRNEPY